MVWFLLFSIVPLAFITTYSLVKYEEAIDKEVGNRLSGNLREIDLIFEEFRFSMQTHLKKRLQNPRLLYHVSKNEHNKVRQLAKGWLASSFIQKLKVFNREGLLVVSLFKGEKGEVQRRKSHESSGVYLNEEFSKSAADREFVHFVDFYKGNRLELVVFSAIKTPQGKVIGYLEESLIIDHSFIKKIAHRLGVEVLLFSSGPEDKSIGSHDDLEHYPASFFNKHFEKVKESIFSLNIQEVPYGFRIKPFDWGEKKLFFAVGASKKDVEEVLSNVNTAFYTVMWAIVGLLIVLSLVMSRVLLRPLYAIMDVIEKMDFEGDDRPIEVTESSPTELGTLAKAFNKMTSRIHESQKNLKDKVDELKRANIEIRDTQAKLVHSGKMASLGQLVAGVAHELNNPIGFIYSNMTHLREYSEKLVGLVEVAEKTPKQLEKEKEEAEFDYIVSDLPKLIKSCEDGARRTRDIVLGLRNFSRLEEAKLKSVNIHEGIDTTLKLLSGELKSRIKVIKNYGKLPKVTCYPSQLNQVFMNILSNAAQAITDKGEIHIKTSVEGKFIEISIKDSGKGMSEETTQKIFDPFFTTKSLGRGTGLGMSITYGIIENHQGEIQVKSKLGQGTEFMIKLPITSQPTTQ